MTLDKSLKVRAGLARQRSVLKRVERLEKLKESDRWSEGASVFGLPKVRVQQLVLKQKKALEKNLGSAQDQLFQIEQMISSIETAAMQATPRRCRVGSGG